MGLTLAFVALTLLLVRPLVDRMLARIQARQDDSSGRVLSMVMVLALLGGAMTEALGMHAVFGGFVMGLAIGDSGRLREHTRATLREFVMNVFTPVFFATMALRHDFIASFDARLVAIVLFIACVAKVAGCAVGAHVGGIDWRESIAIGFGMNSRGAMEILLASLAVEANIISPRLFVALVVMAVVTSLISGPAMSRLVRIAASPALELLNTAPITLGLPGASPADVIRAMTAQIASRLGVPERTEAWAEAVLAREDVAGTAIGASIAIPHAEVEGIAHAALAFARTERAVDFNAPDGGPVRLVFLLLLPPAQFRKELQVLAALARLLAREELRDDLDGARDPRDVLAAFSRAERLGQRVRARRRPSV
jgi:mannitol/fructose-specific phosphotransferase system IIA component (Ntr-type)